MELHSPPNLKLPALKYNKSTARDLVENDLKVQNLIRSNLLLDSELNKLLYEIKELTENMNKILEVEKTNFKDTNFNEYLLHPLSRRHFFTRV